MKKKDSISWKTSNGDPLNIPFENICNTKSLLHMAKNGKQPGIKPLMENYLVRIQIKILKKDHEYR